MTAALRALRADPRLDADEVAAIDLVLEAIGRVTALHVRDSVFSDHCAECSDFGTDECPPGARIEWPCATIRALEEREAVERS